MAGALNEHWKALRAASQMILAVYVCKTAFSFLLLGGFGLAVARAAQRADLVHVVTTMITSAPQQFAAAQWTVVAYGLLGPLLTLLVLAALLDRPAGALAAGTRYPQALVISITRFAVLGFLVGWTFTFSNLLATSVQPALETAARVAPLVIGALAALWLETAHDLALASLASDDTPSIRTAFSRGVRGASVTALAVHGAFGLLALLLFAAGEAASRSMPWPIAALVVTQACALAATFAHAGWLSSALARISRRV